MMCDIALFLLFAQSVLLGVKCNQDNSRKMSWSYYEGVDYKQGMFRAILSEWKSSVNFSTYKGN